MARDQKNTTSDFEFDDDQDRDAREVSSQAEAQRTPSTHQLDDRNYRIPRAQGGVIYGETLMGTNGGNDHRVNDTYDSPAAAPSLRDRRRMPPGDPNRRLFDDDRARITNGNGSSDPNTGMHNTFPNVDSSESLGMSGGMRYDGGMGMMASPSTMSTSRREDQRQQRQQQQTQAQTTTSGHQRQHQPATPSNNSNNINAWDQPPSRVPSRARQASRSDKRLTYIRADAARIANGIEGDEWDDLNRQMGQAIAGKRDMRSDLHRAYGYILTLQQRIMGAGGEFPRNPCAEGEGRGPMQDARFARRYDSASRESEREATVQQAAQINPDYHRAVHDHAQAGPSNTYRDNHEQDERRTRSRSPVPRRRGTTGSPGRGEHRYERVNGTDDRGGRGGNGGRGGRNGSRGRERRWQWFREQWRWQIQRVRR